MLCQFSFQNFKSYKDETTFDFRAMAIPEFQDALIRQEKAEDLLPVSAVYGPNGGGKTNLLQAFFCLINLVVKPIHALEKNRQPMIFSRAAVWRLLCWTKALRMNLRFFRCSSV